MFQRNIKAISIATALLVGFNVQGGAAETTAAARDFSFVEMKSANLVLLNQSERKFIYGEVAEDASFCQIDSAFYCIITHDFEFAFPKKLDNKRKWKYGSRIFCVVQSFRESDKEESSRDRNGFGRAYVVFSRSSGDCTHTGPYDMRAIFSTETGLRAIFVNTSTTTMELISIDHYGFGGSLGETTR